MARYILTRRVYNTLVGRGYKLICKICGCQLQINDCVESKPSKYRRRKFYHCDCYDGSFMDIGNGDDDETNESK